MKMEYPYFDYVWIAADSLGMVGAFVTGGEGPVPLTMTQSDENLLPLIEQKLTGEPLRGEGKMILSYPKSGSFVTLAERGVFVYDWTDVHKTKANECGSYELVCIPTHPVTVDDLSEELQRIAVSISLTGVAFNERAFLDVRQYVSCIQRPDR